MTYVPTYERQARAEGIAEGTAEGKAEGIAQGLQDGIALALKLKFSTADAALIGEIRQINDATILRCIMESIEHSSSIDQVRRSLRESGR